MLRSRQSVNWNSYFSSRIHSMTNLHSDFKEFLELLNEKRVRYVIVGAYAVAVHGVPRNTQDLDVFISNDNQNVVRILEVLDAFGFKGMHSEKDFCSFGVQLGVAPVRIDLLSAIDGVTFEEAEQSAMDTLLDGIPIRVIGRQALIKNKRAAGRPKDLADVYTLEETTPQ